MFNTAHPSERCQVIVRYDTVVTEHSGLGPPFAPFDDLRHGPALLRRSTDERAILWYNSIDRQMTSKLVTVFTARSRFSVRPTITKMLALTSQLRWER